MCMLCCFVFVLKSGVGGGAFIRLPEIRINDRRFLRLLLLALDVLLGILHGTKIDSTPPPPILEASSHTRIRCAAATTFLLLLFPKGISPAI